MSQPDNQAAGAPLVQPSKFGRRLGTTLMVFLVLCAVVLGLGMLGA